MKRLNNVSSVFVDFMEQDKVENYEKAKADNFNGWDCHHRLETHTSDGEERPFNAQLSMEELIALGVYYNRPAEELIYLTREEHMSIHKRNNTYWVGKHHSEETKKAISEKNKGKVLTEEWRKKQSESHKNSEKCREAQKRATEAAKVANTGRHHTEDAKNRIANSHKGKKYWTNGVITITAFECPEGFWHGITRRK